MKPGHLIIAVALFILALAALRFVVTRPPAPKGDVIELVYLVKPPDGEPSPQLVAQTMDVVKARLPRRARRRVLVEPSGQDRILIRFPKAEAAEVAPLKSRLSRIGLLEFRLALNPADFSDEYERAGAGEPVAGYEPMVMTHKKSPPPGGGAAQVEETMCLVKSGEPAITGRLIDEVYASQDWRGQPAIGFQFNPQGSGQFATVTERNRDSALAIILDGKLLSAPIIMERVAGSGLIEGDFTMPEAYDLAVVLSSGPLPADLELIEERENHIP